MTSAETEMRASLHQICKEGVFLYAKTPRLQWIDEQLGMVTLLGSQIWWTWETEDVFRRVLGGVCAVVVCVELLFSGRHVLRVAMLAPFVRNTHTHSTAPSSL